jgi:hypothetical protein
MDEILKLLEPYEVFSIAKWSDGIISFSIDNYGSGKTVSIKEQISKFEVDNSVFSLNCLINFKVVDALKELRKAKDGATNA